jgi:hypothetical protein
MHTFFLDLWHDLREKRLWPVAALLLVAIAAVPFVMLEKEQPAPAPAAPPQARAETASDKLPTIALEDAAATSPSKLGEFSERNPFKPLNDLPKPAADADDGDGENQTVDLGESPDEDARASASGGSGGSGGSPASDSGDSAPAGGSGDGTGSGAGSYVGPRTTYYAYRADIRFGLAGKAKAMKQVKAFTLLGEEDAPAALFMGVTDDHKYAVFAVDTARYEADGEHDCKPSPERCEFVYLKAAESGNETTFTTLDGQQSYDLKLTAIKRVVLDKEDVENVPTENDKSDDKDSTVPAGKAKVVDAEPRSLFDVLAKRR